MENQKQSDITVKKWSSPASKDEIEKTIKALKKNGISAQLTENRDEAKRTVLSLIPEKGEIMNMTSVTL